MTISVPYPSGGYEYHLTFGDTIANDAEYGPLAFSVTVGGIEHEPQQVQDAVQRLVDYLAANSVYTNVTAFRTQPYREDITPTA